MSLSEVPSGGAMAKVASQHARAVTLRAQAHRAATSSRTPKTRPSAKQVQVYALRLRPHSVRARMQHARTEDVARPFNAAASSSVATFSLRFSPEAASAAKETLKDEDAEEAD